MKWSETVTLEFVKMYLKHECLWNPSDPTYKLKYIRERAYADIIAEFKATTSKSLSMPEVRIKIKNLRTTYLQQVHKIIKKSSPDYLYQPSLIWFHEMDKCLKNLPSTHTALYTEPQESREVDSSCQIWVDTEPTNNEEENPDPLVNQSDDEIEPIKSEPETSRIKKERRHSLSPPYKVKKRKYKHDSSVVDCSKNCNTDIRKEDEFDIYGKFIASQLRNMNLQKALKLQLEIQTLVSEARLSDLSDD